MEINLIIICKLIILMFIFSCAGWLIEVILKFIKYHRFINRGYLIGPYCPIYGGGVVAVTLLEMLILQGEGSYLEVFFLGMLACGILEYFVSWFMETMYHARWWDYSTKPMNLNGRIWIGNLILFGLGSVLVLKWINPLIFGYTDTWSDQFIILVAVFIVVLLITDNICSSILMNVVKREIDAREEDNTEEISQKVRALLKDRSLLMRRINEAYPNLQARPKHLTMQLKEAKKEMNRAMKVMKTEFKEYLVKNQQTIAEEKKEALNLAKERLAKAKRQLREIQDKFNYHNWKY